MPAIVYDTGALLAAERDNPDFLALHDELTRARIRPFVPVVVLAQAWRGGPLPQLDHRHLAAEPRPVFHCSGQPGSARVTTARSEIQNLFIPNDPWRVF